MGCLATKGIVMKRFLLILSICYATNSLAGSPPIFGLPVDCRIGKTCWLVNLVDLDKGPGVRDYLCQRQSYDGHKGTDIAIRDLSAMAREVPVLSAATGHVKAFRDGVADWDYRSARKETFDGKECGNGVVLSHGDGWESQYCHLKLGSVQVKLNERIAAGKKIGVVGLSGKTEFPHIHFSIRKNGRVIDPFIGISRSKKCQSGDEPLWEKRVFKSLTKPLNQIYNYGFSSTIPNKKSIRSGLNNSETLPGKSPALIFWTDIIRPKKSDKLSLKIISPSGKILFLKNYKFVKSYAMAIRYGGKRRQKKFWEQGVYKGEATLEYMGGGNSIRTQTVYKSVLIK